MRKTTIAILGVMFLGLVALNVIAQDWPYRTGAFLPLEDQSISGRINWRGDLSPWRIEGATEDAFEATITFQEPTADFTINFPDGNQASYMVMPSTLTTNEVGAANSVWGVSNGITFEGVTADAGELFLTVADIATASRTMTLPDMGAASAVMASTLTTNTVGAANSVWGVSNGLTFEGLTANAGELFLTVADIATASRTMTLPDMGAASAVLASTLTTNTVDVANSIWGVSNGLAFGGATGANGFETTITPTDPTADRTVTLQNATGTVTLQTGATITLTNVDLDTTDNSIAANVCEDQAAVTATGVATTDNLLWVMTTSDLSANFSISHIVPSAANQVTIRVCNETAGALDPGAVADFRLVPIL